MNTPEYTTIHLPWRHVALEAGKPEFWTSVLLAEVNELAHLAHGKKVLEIGTAQGFAAVAIAKWAQSVTTVDIPGGWVGGQESVEEIFRAYERTNITRILESSVTYLPKLVQEGWEFGLIFIDGDHSADVLREDFLNSAELIKPGGNIAVHDYLEDCCQDVKPTMDDIIPEGPDYIIGTMAVYRF